MHELLYTQHSAFGRLLAHICISLTVDCLLTTHGALKKFSTYNKSPKNFQMKLYNKPETETEAVHIKLKGFGKHS